jgi:1,4-alpha-glucan branching enzyme
MENKMNNSDTNAKCDEPIALRYEEQYFVDSSKPVWNYSLFTDEDVRNFQRGTHYRLYEHFGAHHRVVLDRKGYYFSVWAPNATQVSVISPFNNWNTLAHPLRVREDRSGIWEGFIPDFPLGVQYKYHINGFQGVELDKGDPFAQYCELRPGTASISTELKYGWGDQAWMDTRKAHNKLEAPWNVYEVHLGSWMRPDKFNEERYNTYEQLRELLVPYVKDMGFTHVEFMPVMEHPFDGSWGYQGTGYFAPTSRFGTPEQFMALIDAFHAEGIGVVLDWVPSHFPYDAHGLFLFDGAHTYEYADMRKGYHPDWSSYVFNYRRGEVKSFLISSAHFWFRHYHMDGIRVDAVSSMLKLNYSRKVGEWEPNEYGGDGNMEAIGFIKDLNETIYRDFPDVQTIAEEATDWPKISRPTFEGGLGFGMKWMMGWMHDTLSYFKLDPVHRGSRQDNFTFSLMYFYDENFMLPLSHDEVVHGKSPMIYKMPGDEWQKCANLRLLYSYMYTHPGSKLLFMGDEFGSTKEWNYKSELPWELLGFDSHRGIKDCVKALGHLYQSEPALYELQFQPGGFEWVDLGHREESVIAYRRKGIRPADDIVVILNMTPVVRLDWKVVTYGKSEWKEVFNSDIRSFWGTGDTYNPSIPTHVTPYDSKLYELTVHLPPLGAIVLK